MAATCVIALLFTALALPGRGARKTAPVGPDGTPTTGVGAA